MSLVAELQRRRVIRALIGYGIAAFAVLQIIEPIMHGLHWPDAVLSYVVVALAVGFPLVVTLAWIFDVKAGRIEGTQPAARGGLKGARLAFLLLGIGVLVAAPGTIWYFVVRGISRPMAEEGRKSIAVLPFASLSTGEDNSYFADGIHDELLRQLSRIGDLSVISRTSVLQYKSETRNLREIGEELGVSSILEGSVQRDGNHVRVQAKLIDARTDRQIWADRYDRDLTDIFAIEAAVAEEIARALKARLSPAEEAGIARKPTENAQAYDLYLQALDYGNRPGRQPDNMAIAEQLYRKAIETDPSFALARARLANLQLVKFFFINDTPDDVAEDAKEEAERSLRLQPDLPEGHLALGYYSYWRHLDYERALNEFEIAHAGAPGQASFAAAAVLRRQGRFDESIHRQQEAVRLDPRSAELLQELGYSLVWTRRYEEADRTLQRALMMAPDYTGASILRATALEVGKGETGAAKEVLRQAHGKVDPQGRLGQNAFLVYLLQYNPTEALPLLDSVESPLLHAVAATYPRVMLQAVAHEALGDPASARTEYLAAVSWLEPQVAQHPRKVGERALLARCYAALGRKAEAMREATQAVDTLPMSKDAYFGSLVATDRAIVEARVGEHSAAIGHIRYLLSVPSLLSPALLRIDPRWAPLHDDPAFRQLAGLDPR